MIQFRQTRNLLIGKYQFGDLIQRRQNEDKIVKQIRKNLNPTYLQVIDTTIGKNSCGTMYKILVQSPLFHGKSKVQQHQMVAKSIEKQLQFIHGFNLKTKVPIQILKTQSQKKIQ